MRTALAVARVQFRILRHDPWFLLIMFGMPVVVIPVFHRVVGVWLEDAGYPGADGSEIVVPGQMVLFGFFLGGSVGFSIFREHGWRTWDRLRASAAAPAALLAGFALPWIIIHVLYSLAVLLAGSLIAGLRLDGGSPLAVFVMLIAYGSCVVALMLLATATLRTAQQFNGVQNVGAMLLGGLGGALMPLEVLPGWAQTIAPFTPAYWAMRGHRSIFLEQGGLADVALPAAVLLAAASVLAVLATTRFRVDETKEFFA